MALSKCIKLLQHVTEDTNGNLIPLAAPYDPHFTTTTKLTNALTTAMNAPRTTAGVYDVVKKLGIDTFAKCNVPPFDLGLALVDLSGATRLTHPEYATFSATDKKTHGSGSIFKLAPILASQQLRFDVLGKIANAPAGDQKTRLKWAFDQLRADWKAKGVQAGLQPDLEKIIVLTDAGVFDFEPTYASWMDAITHPKSSGNASIDEMNKGAAYLIVHLQWTYIASVMLQTGITDTTDGGLWVSGLGKKYIWTCDLEGGAMPVPAKSGFEQQATAVSLARYLTLATQNVLVAQLASTNLKAVLDNGDANWLLGGLAEANQSTGGNPSNLSVINPDLANHVGSVKDFGKHGALGPWAGEALGIQRDSSQGQLRYVVACLTTQKKTGVDYDDMLNFMTKAFIPAMDGVILTNNTP